MKKRTVFLMIFSILMILAFSSISVSAATATMPGVKIRETKGSKEWNYTLSLGLPGKSKIGTPTYNAVIILPKSLLAKKNRIAVEGRIDLIDPSIKNNDQYIGTAPSSAILVKVSNNGAISFDRIRGYDGKKIGMGKVKVSIKALSGKKYYAITIKNMPIDTTYFPKGVNWDIKNKKNIDKTKKFKYNILFEVGPWGKLNKDVTDCVYLAECTLKAGKNLRMNFTGNFQNFDAWSWRNGKNGSPTRKIATLTY